MHEITFIVNPSIISIAEMKQLQKKGYESFQQFVIDFEHVDYLGNRIDTYPVEVCFAYQQDKNSKMSAAFRVLNRKQRTAFVDLNAELFDVIEKIVQRFNHHENTISAEEYEIIEKHCDSYIIENC